MNTYEAGRELDATIAREVFGRDVREEPGPFGEPTLYMRDRRDDSRRRPVTGWGPRVPLAHYATNIESAWRLVEHLMAAGHGYTFGSGTWPDGKRYHTARFFTDDHRKIGMGDGETLPLAICRAALAVLGAE